ncbi:MAG TPA: hypothetical protein VHU81_10195 [Thermoanaerobaculia bacterium]|jgi:hypothetical protein|nr:hypothetical protein [Thermoanaerobaculia bacterium]
MEKWPPVGKHTATFEEPDVIFMRLVGPVSEAEGLEINRRHQVMSEGRDTVFYLIDLAELDSIHPAVRKAAGETLRNLPVHGAFLFRAPLKAKVAAKLIFTAMNMFKSAADKIEILFFDNEEEARAAMARRREELARARRG